MHCNDLKGRLVFTTLATLGYFEKMHYAFNYPTANSI